jgi:hypothetical protein
MQLPNGLISRKFSARSFALPPGQKRDLIMLHYTEGGTASGAVSWWQTLYRQSGNRVPVGTAFIVDRDGTIYEVFDHKTQWAWQLGINDRAQESRAIGIEFVNWGPLGVDPKTGEGFPWRQLGNIQTRLPASDIVKAGGVWRKSTALHQKFTDQQYSSGVLLVKQLCKDFDIPYRIPPEEKRDELDLAWAKQWTGIASHQNFTNQRLDIGPAWDWSVFGA